MARASAWAFGGFVVRRLGELALMLAMGWVVSRHDLGRFNAWKAILQPLAVLTTGAWDVVLLRRRRNAAVHAELLALWTMGASLTLAVALLLFGGHLAAWYREPDLAWCFRLAGISMAASATARVVRAALARDLDQATIARWEIIRLGIFGIGAAAVMLGIEPARAELFWAAVGLIAAWSFADVAEASGLAFITRGGPLLRGLWRRSAESRLGFLRRRAAVRREWRFAALLTADQTLNALSAGLPIYLLGRRLGPESVAFFAYGLQLVALPLYTMLETVNRVALPGLGRVARASIPERILELVRHLSLASMPVLLWSFAAAPLFFTLVLGPEWEMAGLLTRCFVVYLLLAPMTTISGPVEALVGRPSVGLVWNAITLVGRAAVLWWGLRWGGLLPAMVAYALFSLAQWIWYQYLIGAMLGLGVMRVVGNWARFIPVWGTLLGFWMLWPDVDAGRAERLAMLLGGGAAGLVVYAVLLGLFHRPHLVALFRILPRRSAGTESSAPTA